MKPMDRVPTDTEPCRVRKIDIMWHGLLCAVPCTLLAVLGLFWFVSPGFDDLHLTYWPAYTLANFGKMVNYNGEYVEQSSSLLHVLTLAGIAKITGIAIPTFGKLLSLFFGMATLVAIYAITARMSNWVCGLCAAMLTSLWPGFVFWSLGGLETTLVAFLTILTIITIAHYLEKPSRRSLACSCFVMLMYELARPETVILLGCALLGLLAVIWLKRMVSPEVQTSRLTWQWLPLFTIYLFWTLGIFGFRGWYFGCAFPQPTYVKARGFNGDACLQGLSYFVSSMSGSSLAMTLVAVVMILGTFGILYQWLRSRDLDLPSILLLLFIAGQFSFIVLVGGDWMQGGRFFLPVMPLMMAAMLIALAHAIPRRLPLLLLMTACLGVEIYELRDFSQKMAWRVVPFNSAAPAWTSLTPTRYSWFELHNTENLRDIYLSEYLNRILPYLTQSHAPVTIMSGSMGLTPYYTAMHHLGRVRFIDRAGLSDRTLIESKMSQILPKTCFGLNTTYDFYFAHKDEYPQIAGATGPDLIYDLDPNSFQRDIAEHGYTLLNNPAGVLHPTPDQLPDLKSLNQQGFVAVRNDLISLIPAELQ